MATAPPNHRASLLSGLRTGGVRSTSTNVPHTAAIGGSFAIPRFASSNIQQPFQEEYEDNFGDMPLNGAYANYAGNGFHNGLVTAAVDGPGFSQQQSNRGMNPNSAPFQPSFNQGDMFGQQQQNQALQMQLMQLEILRLQSLQAQQYQADLLAQKQQQQQQQRRPSYNPPATAGPLTTSFDRTNGVRKPQSISQINPRFAEEPLPSVSGTPAATTVISGGIALGVSGLSPPAAPAPSKSDAATSWRRGGNNNSVLSGQNRSPAVKVTPPPGDKSASPPLSGADGSPPKFRPHPLRFSPSSEPAAVVVSDSTDGDDADSLGSYKSSGSSPATSSNGSPTSLSPREEAAKRLYAGLGVGRPTPTPPTPVVRSSQPTRQPRGPPSGIEELGPKNFATRIRRQAIGGLNALMGARERREIVEAY